MSLHLTVWIWIPLGTSEALQVSGGVFGAVRVHTYCSERLNEGQAHVPHRGALELMLKKRTVCACMCMSRQLYMFPKQRLCRRLIIVKPVPPFSQLCQCLCLCLASETTRLQLFQISQHVYNLIHITYTSSTTYNHIHITYSSPLVPADSGVGASLREILTAGGLEFPSSANSYIDIYSYILYNRICISVSIYAWKFSLLGVIV